MCYIICLWDQLFSYGQTPNPIISWVIKVRCPQKRREKIEICDCIYKKKNDKSTLPFIRRSEGNWKLTLSSFGISFFSLSYWADALFSNFPISLTCLASCFPKSYIISFFSAFCSHVCFTNLQSIPYSFLSACWSCFFEVIPIFFKFVIQVLVSSPNSSRSAPKSWSSGSAFTSSAIVESS